MRAKHRDKEIDKMRGVKAMVGLGVLLVAIPGAQAAGRDAKERAAKRACLMGDVAKGMAILTDLYIDTNDPTYIFNQGRCFEQNLRYSEALARFREFLVKAVTATGQDRAAAENHIASCQSYLGSKDVAPTPPASPQHPRAVAVEPPRPAPPPQPEPAAATPHQEPTVVSAQGQVPTVQAGSGMRTAAIVTAAVGGAALIAGVILNIKVNTMASDLQAEGAYSRSKESQRVRYETLGWVSYGVGAACVATGSVLYYLGRDPGHSATASIALVPALAPDNVGAVLKGTF